MRVIGLAGSPRGTNSVTLKLLEAGLQGAAASGAECALMDIDRLHIGRCKDCGECYRTGRCAIDDDLSYVLDSMLAADGIIMSSPAFAGGVTSGIECLMDRMGDAAHCRILEGKYGLSISASRNGNAAFVVAHMDRFLEECGVAMVGSVALDIGKDKMDEAVRAVYCLGGQLVEAISKKRCYPGHDESLHKFFREFEDAVRSNKEAWAHDYRYWSDKGWLKIK